MAPVNVGFVHGCVYVALVKVEGFVKVLHDLFPVLGMVAYADVLVARHDEDVEPFGKREASRCSVDIGIVYGNVVFLVVNFVDVGHVTHFDVVEFNVRAEGASVFVLVNVAFFGGRHGIVYDDSVGEGKAQCTEGCCYDFLKHVIKIKYFV